MTTEQQEAVEVTREDEALIAKLLKAAQFWPGHEAVQTMREVAATWRAEAAREARIQALEEAANKMREMSSSICGSCEWDEAQRNAFNEPERLIRSFIGDTPHG